MKRNTFTLIELLTALVIIVVLAGMILGASSVVNRISKKRNAQAHIKALEIILEQYKTDWGFYPESNGILELGSWNAWYFLNLREPKSLPTQANYDQAIYVDLFAGAFKTQVDQAAKSSPPTLVPATPAYHNYFVGVDGPLYIVDPYLQPFFYQNPGAMNAEKFDLWSKGKDGQPGEAGVDDDGDGTVDNPSDAQSINALDSDDISNWKKN